ncbi:hypothetical protein [Reichenbachiella agariperforans]|uniref:hypothetical protein n=1 Tax=Reichenbachiella agariperforans TaxID=156994 RepID=UPI001C0978A4|nr:hypothetical protein [Reichenbachiella agariperforans]MBU2914260.1 hypothetical protein [Reichenbachiella agariperforans]
MKEKYIQYLKDLIEIPITSGYDLDAWKSKAINVITRIYGENSKPEEQINNIKFRSYPMFGTVSRGRSTTSGGGNNSASCKELANSIIEGIINEIETFDLPEINKTPKSNGINISVNQSNNQDVKIDVKIVLSAIQDELTGKQLNELQQIVEGEGDSDKKRSRIFDKIKSFGLDVTSNILANLLTNPQLFG